MPGTDLIAPSEYRALTISDQDFRAAVGQLVEQDVGAFDLARVKIPSGGGTTWVVPSPRGDVETKELTGVVIFAKSARAYWPGKYEGANDPPTCASEDGRVARARPVTDPETGEEKIAEIPADKDDAGRLLCDTCSYAEFGSGEGRRQACKQMRQVFMLLPDRLLPALLTLPPTSLKNARQYFLGLVDIGVAQHAVVTQVTLTKQKNEGTPEFSVANFRAGEALSAEQAARAEAYATAARPRFMRVVATADDLPQEG